MKAVVIPAAGATPAVHDDVEVPSPVEGEILVKTLYVAVNPVDAMMAQYGGPAVQSWPFTPGCDVAGTVIKAGPHAMNAFGQPFKEGDEVFGCTRVGAQGYSAWAEYLLMNAEVTFPKPSNINFAQASATGVGILTASLGVFHCLRLPLLDPDNLPAPDSKNQWALVLGGAGSVGQFAVQLLKLCGFKVITTCSTKSFDLLKSIGATACIDYKRSNEEIVGEIKTSTGGQLFYALDAVSVNNDLLANLYSALPPTDKPRLYTTTNDWDPLPKGDFTVAPIQLGPIGQPVAKELNKRLAEFIPVLFRLIETGLVKAAEYSIEGQGIAGILTAWNVQKTGAQGSKKVVINVADG